MSATRDVVEVYYRAAFGGEPPDSAETARLRRGLTVAHGPEGAPPVVRG